MHEDERRKRLLCMKMSIGNDFAHTPVILINHETKIICPTHRFLRHVTTATTMTISTTTPPPPAAAGTTMESVACASLA